MKEKRLLLFVFSENIGHPQPLKIIIYKISEYLRYHFSFSGAVDR